MVVNPKSSAHSVADFIKLAKEQPGKLSFGSGSSSSRVAGELFQQMAGVELLHVPYKSNPLVITDLLGGQIDMMMADMATGLPQVKAGKLRALGVTTPQASPLAPEVPTIADAGVPGYQMGYWFGAYVPAGTPADVVSTLHDLLVNATTRTAATQFYTQTGTKPVTSSPDELADFQAEETQKWGDIIKKAGIEPA
jgi:tripartite-type tricarboxylate transporter receptor subunit TctC